MRRGAWSRHPLFTPALVVSVGMLTAAALGLQVTVNNLKIALKKEAIYPDSGRLTTDIPSETATWQKVSERRETAEVEATLGTSNYVSRVYERRSPWKGRRVLLDVHLAYYTGSIDTVPHVPDRCFVGGGMQIGSIEGDLPLPLDASRWSIDETVPEDLAGRVQRVRLASGAYARLPQDPGEIRLRTMKFLSAKSSPVYAGYFFIANGRTTPSAEDVRLLAFDLKARHAYYMKVQFTSSSVESGAELAELAASVLDEMMGEVMLCVPDWVRVVEGSWPPPPGPGGTGS